MRNLKPGQVLLVATMLAMLGLAALGIAWAWDATSDVDMDENGWIALGLGSFFSLVIGCGLMALMFFSSRRGYDDAADPFRNRESR